MTGYSQEKLKEFERQIDLEEKLIKESIYLGTGIKPVAIGWKIIGQEWIEEIVPGPIYKIEKKLVHIEVPFSDCSEEQANEYLNIYKNCESIIQETLQLIRVVNCEKH